MSNPKAITVTAAVIENDAQVLIVRKRAGTRHAGRWEFPGGKVETGERPEACLKREIYEELGIHARVRQFLCESVYSYPHATIRLLAFRVDWHAGQIRLTDHDASAWVPPAELSNWDLLPADVPIAEVLAASHARSTVQKTEP